MSLSNCTGFIHFFLSVDYPCSTLKNATDSASYSKMATQVPLKWNPGLQELALSIT